MATVLMVMTGLSRAAVIYPISALANKCRPRFMNIPIHYQHMLFYGGLIRGSVTVALAYHELGASVDENGVPDEVENDSARGPLNVTVDGNIRSEEPNGESAAIAIAWRKNSEYAAKWRGRYLDLSGTDLADAALAEPGGELGAAGDAAGGKPGDGAVLHPGGGHVHQARDGALAQGRRRQPKRVSVRRHHPQRRLQRLPGAVGAGRGKQTNTPHAVSAL
eukprot:1175764-Prorocentrum_minimum.AAC.2